MSQKKDAPATHAPRAATVRGKALLPSEAVLVLATGAGRTSWVRKEAVAAVSEEGGETLVHLAGGGCVSCRDEPAELLAQLGWADDASGE